MDLTHLLQKLNPKTDENFTWKQIVQIAQRAKRLRHPRGRKKKELGPMYDPPLVTARQARENERIEAQRERADYITPYKRLRYPFMVGWVGTELVGRCRTRENALERAAHTGGFVL